MNPFWEDFTFEDITSNDLLLKTYTTDCFYAGEQQISDRHSRQSLSVALSSAFDRSIVDHHHLQNPPACLLSVRHSAL